MNKNGGERNLKVTIFIDRDPFDCNWISNSNHETEAMLDGSDAGYEQASAAAKRHSIKTPIRHHANK
jgi:urocanate hydratase